MLNIIFPKGISLESKIGLTAMSSGIEDERDLSRIDNGVKHITEKGFEIVETPDVRTCSKFVSASAKQRAEEFLGLWNREDISYIAIAFGGEFLMETLPYIDRNIITSATPKWVQGFSDVSLLNFFLTTNFNIATMHTYSFTGYAMDEWHKSIEIPFAFAQNPDNFTQTSYELFEMERNRGVETATAPFNLTEKVVYKNLYENSGNNNEEVTISGRLIGGCMDVLKVIIGTKMDKTKEFCEAFPEGMLWYLENCEMPITDFKRTLWQMKQVGWFDNANGFIIGRTRANLPMGDFTYEDALHDVLDDMNVPVIYDVDFGHVAPQWTMINGSFAEFKYKNGAGSIRQEMK